MSRVAAIVLAAGEASRFGAPKQLILMPAVLERLALSPVDEVVVVEGAYTFEPTRPSEPPVMSLRIVACPAWREGPGTSLRCGLAALGEDVGAAVVVLADGPDLSPAAVERVLASWRAGRDAIVAASYGGVRGHPLVIGRRAWAQVPAAGLRKLPAVLVACDDLGTPGDVDHPDDLPQRFR